MNVTLLGLVIMPLCLISFRNGQRLLSIAMFATVFEAASLLNVQLGGFEVPVIPPYFPGLVFILFCALRYAAGRSWGNESAVGRVYLPFLLFAGYCLATALIIPQVFAGDLLVFPQRPFLENPVPLYFGTNNISQLSYLLFMAVFAVMATCYVERRPWLAGRLLHVSFVAGYVAVAFGVWQLVSVRFGLYFPQEFLVSNPVGSIQMHDQTSGDIIRVAGSFREPSDLAGHVSGTVFAAFWLILAGDRRPFVVGIFALSMVLLLLSTSTTGYIVLAAGLPAMMIVAALVSGSARALLRLLKVFACCAAGLSLAFLVVSWVSPELGAAAGEVFQNTLQKEDSLSFAQRAGWDAGALALVAPTLGFGGGWGSSRTSSLLPAILGNGGLWGSALFLWFGLRAASVVRRARRRLALHPQQQRVMDALSASVLGCLFAAVLSGPNLSVMDAWLPLAAVLGMAIRTLRMSAWAQDLRRYRGTRPGAPRIPAWACGRPET